MSPENIDKLKDELFSHYRGKQISAHDLFEEHQTNCLYSRSHYTEALRRLVGEQNLFQNIPMAKTIKKQFSL